MMSILFRVINGRMPDFPIAGPGRRRVINQIGRHLLPSAVAKVGSVRLGSHLFSLAAEAVKAYDLGILVFRFFRGAIHWRFRRLLRIGRRLESEPKLD